MLTEAIAPKERYQVRFFVDDDVVETQSYAEPNPPLIDAVCWSCNDPDVDYVEVLRHNDNGTDVRLLWMNCEAEGGIEIREDDPDYELVYKYWVEQFGEDD